ncbi:hypothetical protein SESBI_43632 [Sesbania bispinosa]|nr:hypothetical protein SESBI_43632 [Sesbania bispinosa]
MPINIVKESYNYEVHNYGADLVPSDLLRIAQAPDYVNAAKVGGDKEQIMGLDGPNVIREPVGPSLQVNDLDKHSKKELGKSIIVHADGGTIKDPIANFIGPMTNHEMLDTLQQHGPLGAMHSFAELKDSSAEEVHTLSLADFNHSTAAKVPRSEAVLEGTSLNGDRGAMCRDGHVCATFDLLEDQLCEIPILEATDLDVVRLFTSSSTATIQGIKLKRGRGRQRKKTLQKNKVSEPACSMNNEFLSLVQNPESVANKVWEIGRALGLSGYHDEFEAVNRLVEMEKRDRVAVGKVENQ